jgi:hypothetical protein
VIKVDGLRRGEISNPREKRGKIVDEMLGELFFKGLV